MESKEMKVAEFGDGRVMKMEKDLSGDVDELLKRTAQLEQQGKWQEAVDLMMNMEKRSRLMADSPSNNRLQVAIVTVCFNAKQLPALLNCIAQLCKKRSLIKSSMVAMVQACYGFLARMPNKEDRLKLIDALMSVTAGKIYVEVERARLLVMLAEMKEQDGDLAGAKNTILELQVESCGSMEKREKVTTLLHQLRLCTEVKDFIRAGLVAKKISPKTFSSDDDDAMQQLHVHYRRLVIVLEEQNDNCLAMARHYRMLSQIPCIQSNKEECQMALKKFIVYILLSSHDSEQFDMLRKISLERTFDVVPEYRNVVRLFIRQELLNWTKEIVQPYEKLLRFGTPTSPATGIFDPNTDLGTKNWHELKVRAGEHSMRMIAKYYSRINLDRMAELLDWPRADTEQFLCRLIVGGIVIGAKIDRPNGVVSFKNEPSGIHIMDEWVHGNTLLMQQLNKAAHLISKEEMLQQTFKDKLLIPPDICMHDEVKNLFPN